MTKKIVLILLFSLSLIFIFSHLSYQEEEETLTQNILSQIRQKIENINSYKVDYQVFLRKDTGKMELFTQGNISFKRPDIMLMKAGLPGEIEPLQILVSDGKTLWQYVSGGKIASKIDLNQLKQELQEDYVKKQLDFAQLLRGVKKDSIKFLGIREFKGAQVYLLEAKADKSFSKTTGMNIYSIKSWIGKNDGIARQISYYDSNGKEIMRHTYQNILINIKFPNGYFTFNVPEDVQIIDMTESTIKAIKKSKQHNDKE